MTMITLEGIHGVNVLPPVADAGNGNIATDIVDMSCAAKAHFIVQKGVGTTGTSTITIEACDDTTPSNTTAVPFRYRNITSGDTVTAVTEATSAGFTTTAGSNHHIQIEVDAVEIAKAGYRYVRLAAAESADDPVLFGVYCLLSGLRYSSAVGDSYID